MQTTMLLTVLLLGYVAAVQLTAAYPYQLEEPNNGDQLEELTNQNGDQLMEPTNGNQLEELINGDQLMEPTNGDQLMEPTNGNQLEELTNGDQLMEPTNGDQTITELKARGSIDDKGTTERQNEIGEVEAVPCLPLYRYYSGGQCDHFYTTNTHEIGTTTPGVTGNHGYTSEGSEGLIHSIQSTGTIPLHRYYRGGGDHFYTTNVNEIGTTTVGLVGKHGYVYEGVAGYCFPTQFRGTIPLHRYYKGGSCHDHFYTTNASEIGTHVVGVVGRYGYVYEGVACYIEPTLQKHGGGGRCIRALSY